MVIAGNSPPPALLSRHAVDWCSCERILHLLQGREADIVIFSCVRAKSRAEGDKPGVGFLADVRRMNVALTRARRALWIVGHSETLKVQCAGSYRAQGWDLPMRAHRIVLAVSPGTSSDRWPWHLLAASVGPQQQSASRAGAESSAGKLLQSMLALHRNCMFTVAPAALAAMAGPAARPQQAQPAAARGTPIQHRAQRLEGPFYLPPNPHDFSWRDGHCRYSGKILTSVKSDMQQPAHDTMLFAREAVRTSVPHHRVQHSDTNCCMHCS